MIFFEKVNKVDKTLIRLTKQAKDTKTQNLKINEIATHMSETKITEKTILKMCMFFTYENLK